MASTQISRIAGVKCNGSVENHSNVLIDILDLQFNFVKKVCCGVRCTAKLRVSATHTDEQADVLPLQDHDVAVSVALHQTDRKRELALIA